MNAYRYSARTANGRIVRGRFAATDLENAFATACAVARCTSPASNPNVAGTSARLSLAPAGSARSRVAFFRSLSQRWFAREFRFGAACTSRSSAVRTQPWRTRCATSSPISNGANR